MNNREFWFDTAGKPINAHGGGMLDPAAADDRAGRIVRDRQDDAAVAPIRQVC